MHLSLGDRSLLRAPSQFSLASLLRSSVKHSRRMARYLACAIRTSYEISPSSRCSGRRRIGERGASHSSCTHAVIGKRRIKKKAIRFRRCGITCGEERRRAEGNAGEGWQGMENRRLRPSFSAALPIYILRRIYPRMCMFLISWMHAAFTRTRGY